MLGGKRQIVTIGVFSREDRGTEVTVQPRRSKRGGMLSTASWFWPQLRGVTACQDDVKTHVEIATFDCVNLGEKNQPLVLSLK